LKWTYDLLPLPANLLQRGAAKRAELTAFRSSEATASWREHFRPACSNLPARAITPKGGQNLGVIRRACNGERRRAIYVSNKPSLIIIHVKCV